MENNDDAPKIDILSFVGNLSPKYLLEM